MARDLTPLILNRIHTRTGTSYYLLDIDVPVGEASGRLVFPIGSASIVVNGKAYYPGLVDLGDINQSRNKVPSDVTGAIENVSGLFAQILSDPEVDLDGSDIVLSSAWLRDDGGFDLDQLIIGTIEDTHFAGDKMTFRLVSDATQTGLTIGADPIGPRCRYIFGGPGCDYYTQSTLPIEQRIHIDCGKSHADCADRGNTHRHPAIPSLQPLAQVAATGQLPGTTAEALPNGWPSDGGLTGDPFGYVPPSFSPGLDRYGL